MAHNDKEMTTSILNDCLLLRKKEPHYLQEYFTTINVTIFDTIFAKSEPLEAQQTVLFIVCGYSEESPLLILRQDSKEEKMGICEFLDIPDFLRADLINLKNPDVRRAVTSYMHAFSGPLFRSLMFMKIQYNDFELDVTNRAFTIKKSETEGDKVIDSEIFDVKEHGKGVAEMNRLAVAIDRLEKQLKSQVKRMEGIDEMLNYIDAAKRSGKISGGRRGNVEGYITATK